MVDEVETPKVLDELARNNSAPAQERSKRRKRTALRRIVVVLLLLSPLVLGVLALGYQQWNLYLNMNRLATENSRLMETLRASNARISELEVAICC